jgi:GNAT superfamily N-acetyltransferase
MADLWERLVETDRNAARALAESWRQSTETLPQRLHLHALSIASAFSATEVAWLLSSEDALFWGLDYRREVMRLLAERWPEFAAPHRLALERRIAGNMPLTLFRKEIRKAPEIPTIIAHETFTRLSRLAAIAPGLSELGTDALRRVSEAHPHWVASGERDDFSSWSEERTGEQGDPELLANIPQERLVEEATTVAERDPLNQGEIWRRFCRVEPERAFAGLRAGVGHEDAQGYAWIPYFWTLDDLDEPDLQRQTLDFLIASPDLDLRPFAHAVVNWLERKREALRTLLDHDPTPLLALWDRLATALFDDPEPDDSERPFDDPITAILNRGEGQLARFLVSELSDRKRQRGEGIAPDLVERFTRLAVESSDRGFVARAALTWDLTFLYALDPQWTRTYLEPFFDWSNAEAPGHWTAYSHARKLMDPDQFTRLKAQFFEAFHRRRGRYAVEGLTVCLVQMVRHRHIPLADRYDLEPEEARQALRWSDEARHTASFIFFKQVEGAAPDAAASLWRTLIGPTFIDLWPMEPQYRREDSTLYLSWMAQRCGDAFPEAVEAVSPALLATGRAAHGLIMHIDDEKGEVLRRFPKAALRLIDVLVDRRAPPGDLDEALETLVKANPEIRRYPIYNHLLGIARRSAS